MDAMLLRWELQREILEEVMDHIQFVFLLLQLTDPVCTNSLFSISIIQHRVGKQEIMAQPLGSARVLPQKTQ